MKMICFIVICAMLLVGCQSQNTATQEEHQQNESTPSIQTTEKKEKPKAKQNDYWEQLVWNPYYDQNGTHVTSLSFPSTWKIRNNAAKGTPVITGPHGVVVINYPLQNYTYPIDPNLQRSFFQSGQPMRAMPGIDALVQQDFVPWASNQGMQYVKHYQIPEVAKVDRWYNDQLYKSVPMQVEIAVIGTEWRKSDGTPFFLLIHLNVTRSRELQMWSYYCTSLEADKNYYEKAKKHLLFALSNAHYELEPIMAYNRSEAEKAGRSWAVHNQRMAQNQANFEAQQRAFVNRSNAVNDAIMNGWKERNAASDRMQERTIDGIYERTNVVDPSTGQKYKVAAGANQYWMNSDGEYISTESHNYNPNLDDNMNGRRWQELKEID